MTSKGWLFFLVLMLCSIAIASPAPEAESTLRNVILIVADDLGYGDLGSFGANGYETPHLDRLASEGVRCTHYYAASSVCSASRAALLTSRYPPRTGVLGVISATRKTHLPLEEVTLAERFKSAGYATAIFGKWHLGNHAAVWPLKQGFDEWQGTIGSNDMGRNKPSLEARRMGKAGVEFVQQDKVVETNPDQRLLTRRYTDLALDFIARKHAEPFFLYLPHNMPHTPIFASDDFLGSTQRGLYGDVISEIDHSVGRVLDGLEKHGLLDQTIVACTSDNGPWLIFGDHGGSNGGLDGGKKQTLEGGMRVPLVIRLPEGLAETQGQVDATPCSALDLGPTLVSLAGVDWNNERPIDGQDVSARWRTDSVSSSTDDLPFFYFYDREVRAIRLGPWKLQLAHTDPQAPSPNGIGYGGERGAVEKVERDQALYHLGYDPGEQYDRSADFPEVMQKLKTFLPEAEAIAQTPEPDFLPAPEL